LTWNPRNNFTCHNHKKICLMTFKNVELSQPQKIVNLQGENFPQFLPLGRVCFKNNLSLLLDFYLVRLLKPNGGSPQSIITSNEILTARKVKESILKLPLLLFSMSKIAIVAVFLDCIYHSPDIFYRHRVQQITTIRGRDISTPGSCDLYSPECFSNHVLHCPFT